MTDAFKFVEPDSKYFGIRKQTLLTPPQPPTVFILGVYGHP